MWHYEDIVGQWLLFVNTKYRCINGDAIELYINAEMYSMELQLFSGLQSSYIIVDSVDIDIMWELLDIKLSRDGLSEQEQFMMIADAIVNRIYEPFSNEILDKLSKQMKDTIHYIINKSYEEMEKAKTSIAELLKVGEEYRFYDYKISKAGDIIVTFINSKGEKKSLLADKSITKYISEYEYNVNEYNKMQSIFELFATLAFHSDLLDYKELNYFLTKKEDNII